LKRNYPINTRFLNCSLLLLVSGILFISAAEAASSNSKCFDPKTNTTNVCCEEGIQAETTCRANHPNNPAACSSSYCIAYQLCLHPDMSGERAMQICRGGYIGESNPSN
jgi:hypothetical protein